MYMHSPPYLYRFCVQETLAVKSETSQRQLVRAGVKVTGKVFNLAGGAGGVGGTGGDVLDVVFKGGAGGVGTVGTGGGVGGKTLSVGAAGGGGANTGGRACGGGGRGSGAWGCGVGSIVCSRVGAALGAGSTVLASICGGFGRTKLVLPPKLTVGTLGGGGSAPKSCDLLGTHSRSWTHDCMTAHSRS